MTWQLTYSSADEDEVESEEPVPDLTEDTK